MVEQLMIVITPSEKLAQWLRQRNLDDSDFGVLPHILSYQHWIILCFRQHLNDTRVVMHAFEMMHVLVVLYQRLFHDATTIEAWHAAQDFMKFWQDGHVYGLEGQLAQYVPSERMAGLLSAYQAHLQTQHLLDTSTIWSATSAVLSDETFEGSIPPLMFYGFHQMSPQLEHHMHALTRHTTCTFHYAIQPHAQTKKIIAIDAQHEKQCIAQLLETHEHKHITLLVHAPDDIHGWHDHLCRHFRHTAKKIIKQDLQSLSTFKPVETAFHVFRLTDENHHDFDQSWITARIARWSTTLLFLQPLALFLATYGANRIHKEAITTWVGEHGEPKLKAWWHNVLATAHQKPTQQSRAQWCTWMYACLKALGWPFVHRMDSRTHQVVQRFIKALQSWPNGMTYSAYDLSWETAIFELEHHMKSIVFQPQQASSGDIEITTPNQYQGQTTDVLVVTGATSQNFPQHTAIHSALHPHRPESDALWHPRHMVSQCHQTRQSWQHNATHLYYSAPMMMGQTAQEPANFLENVEENNTIPLPKQRMHAKHQPKYIDALLTLKKAPYSGNINQRIIQNQAHCAMKAFWQHHAKLESNVPTARDDIKRLRGIVCHQVMAKFWHDCSGQEALKQMTKINIESTLTKHIQIAMQQTYGQIPWFAQPMVLDIEQSEILALLKSFVACEQTTNAFTVVATELSERIQIGQYKLNIRYDRVDQTPKGLRVMDFKTGHAHPSNWLGDRPEDPQMPIYLQSQRNFYSADYGLIHGQGGKVLEGHAFISKQQDIASWSEFVAQSRIHLEQLIAGFVEYDATQNPKHGHDTCQTCDYRQLCRITDREVRHENDHD